MTATASVRICKSKGDVAITSAGIGWSLVLPFTGRLNSPADYCAQSSEPSRQQLLRCVSGSLCDPKVSGG